ncbi:hypothetical protein O3P69_003764 [Scylla paramamosain]|uniref:Uncharacterized protein n=1 Tax=Scylla paramamosain TaxID=85552 RepID=A0AAW0UD70_SCYPA
MVVVVVVVVVLREDGGDWEGGGGGREELVMVVVRGMGGNFTDHGNGRVVKVLGSCPADCGNVSPRELLLMLHCSSPHKPWRCLDRGPSREEPTIEDFILLIGTFVAFIAFILWCCFPIVPKESNPPAQYDTQYTKYKKTDSPYDEKM